MRTPVELRSASREIYNSFCSEHPEVEIDYDKWKTIVYEMNYAFRDYLLETGDKLKLPYGVGEIVINKKKRQQYRKDGSIGLPIDWVKSKKAGKRIYNFNYHTDGYFYGYIWIPKSARFLHSRYYKFKASRDSSRKLAAYLNKPNSEYQYIYREWFK